MKQPTDPVAGLLTGDERAHRGEEQDDDRQVRVHHVVVREGATLTPAELVEFLSSDFAKWQLPESWAFIDEVPRTSVGKFDKKVIRRRYADGALDVQTLGPK